MDFDEQYIRRLPLGVWDFSHRTEETEKATLIRQCREAISAGDYNMPLAIARRALAAHAANHGPAGNRELVGQPYWKSQVDNADRDFPGREDFVHDLLAHLAEYMMELSGCRHGEIDRFLRWLEDELQCDVEELQGKTFIKAYYKHDFNELATRLHDNRTNLRVPADGLSGATIQTAYADSLDVLRPLDVSIQKTDDLIDRIVYSLYGLSEHEVEIIENAL
jgi:hypothetical protein